MSAAGISVAGEPGRDDRVCRLAPGLLVALCGGLPESTSADLRVAVEHDGQLRELDARGFECAPGAGDRQATAWLVSLGGFDGALGDLVLQSGDQRQPLIVDEQAELLCTPAELAVATLSRLGPDRRAPALSFLISAPQAHGIGPSPELSAHLADVCAVLREPLPRTEIAPGVTCALRLEHITVLDERTFWLSGWIHDATPEEATLTAVSPEGLQAQPRPGAVSFHERSDVDQVFAGVSELPNRGFHAYVELEQASHHSDGWLLELRSTGGEAVEDAARNPLGRDPEALRKVLLDPLRTESPDERVVGQQVLPALERLRRREPVQVEQLAEYGSVCEAPDTSIVITTVNDTLIRHQLLGFVDSQDSEGTELIFVVPPGIATAVRRLAGDLHELYRVSFRIATLSRHPGKAEALNAGAALARGRLLILMRDDVFAVTPGWIEALRAFHDGAPAIAAVGPKLIYEDGAIAHLGTAYVSGRRSSRWEPSLAFKGLSSTLEVAREPRRVQALSDACFMIAADLFHARGGLSESYLDGADECADLCLGLAEQGLEVWCAAHVELTYLEHGGWDARPSPAAARFNDWLLDRRWGAQLRASAGAADPERSVAIAPSSRSGSGRPGAPIEILEVRRAPVSDWVLEAELVHPRTGEELEAYAGTHSVSFEGWAIAGGGEPLKVEVRDARGRLAQAPVSIARRDVAQRLPDTPGAQSAGFGTVVGTIGHPQEWQFEVELVREDGERSALATITGRRRPLRSSFEPRLQPLLITTLGRTGSSWLELLLAKHPEIVACRPFIHDARLTSYWAAVLRTLAEPASYLQIIRPELYPGAWWTGEQRPGQLPLHMAETHMARWLGGESVETVAGFCQARIEDFYRELARAEGGDGVRYFAEKCWPEEFTPRIIAELYPEGREILLVRDFRDMVCSILQFNAKRGTQSFGREATDSDNEFIRYLRDNANQMLESWQARHQRSHLMRYEDLIREPETTLAAAFAYLGVANDADTIRDTIAEANAELPAAQRDHRTSESPAASIGRWQRELSAQQRAICEETFGDALEAFGYASAVISRP